MGQPMFSHVKSFFLTNGSIGTLGFMYINVSRKKTVPYVSAWTTEEKAVNNCMDFGL